VAEDADGGGLARAVGPEQAEHGPAPGGEVDAGQRGGRPEGLAQPDDVDDGVHADKAAPGR
jgi:hypothetical protein